jgi:hypothetical protein
VGVFVGVSDIVGVMDGVTDMVGVTAMAPPTTALLLPNTLPTDKLPMAFILFKDAKFDALTKFRFLGVLPGI